MAGPFYFAWVDEGTPFDADAHAVEELKLFTIEIEHAEGDFPTLTIDIKNPKIGLLAPGRKTWAWLSWDDGSSIEPLFFGRLVGVPESIQAETVRLSFIARPTDYVEQQEDIADTLRVAPHWDPAWINEDKWEDVDAVLEARTQLWHIDRISHEVSVSDLLNGEDGTMIFTPGEHLYDALDVSYGQAPVRKVRVEATAQWTQMGSGVVNAMPALAKVWGSQGGAHYGVLGSFSGDGLMNDWPKTGQSMGGGWEVASASINRIDGIRFPTRYQQHEFTEEERNDQGIVTNRKLVSAWYPMWEFAADLKLGYEASRERTELLTFEISADVQSLVSDPAGDDFILLQPKSGNLSVEIDGEKPIGDVGRRAFFPTDRGTQSINYLVCLARSHLLIRARAVEVKFQTKWEHGVALSCRMNAQVQDDRLAGGVATGKIIAYKLRFDDGSGMGTTDITIGCMIGQGNTVTAREGDPSYVEEGYVGAGWQFWTDADIMPIAGEVAWHLPAVDPDDDGIDFNNVTFDNMLIELLVTGGPSAQRTAIQALPSPDPDREFEKVLSQVYTRILIRMKGVTGGPFHTDYALDVSDLMVPKTVDLESAV